MSNEQRMSNSRAFLCAIAILALFVPELSAQNPALASNQVVVLTVENDVQILRAGARDRDKAYTNQILHAGDRGRTYENSRVTLRMHDQSIARFNENSLFQIESPPDPREKTFFGLLKGMVYFFHRQKPSDVK